MPILSHDPVFVFDLDDTLYKEIDFLKSAYRHIAKLLEPLTGHNIYEQMWLWHCEQRIVFDVLVAQYEIPYSVKDLVEIYRYHQPNINLLSDSDLFLKRLRQLISTIGLITDGRSISQRNKIKALGLENFFDYIIISEEFGSAKPNSANYEYYMKNFPRNQYVYVGDNTSKDFFSANQLGWTTICLLDQGENIHKQDFTLPSDYLPQYKISYLSEIIID
jgi:putative hydrolase of the HAD superfamily